MDLGMVPHNTFHQAKIFFNESLVSCVYKFLM